MITEQQIIKYSGNHRVAATVANWFNHYSDQYEVTTPLRICAFISQVAHESGGFKYTREIASGNAYEGRKDLGNIYPGDGKRYKGRGYLQITGRSNYTTLSKYLFKDSTLLNKPDILASPQYAMQSAFWFWDLKGLNLLADERMIKALTRKINGGLNGLIDRVRIYNLICNDFDLPHYGITHDSL